MSYKSINKAPLKFMRRYEAIMSGEEKLDTLEKLKKFWLFAIKQGKTQREMREYIAELTSTATEKSEVMNTVNFAYLGFDPHETGIKDIAGTWESCVVIGKSPYPDVESDEEYSDNIWARLEIAIQSFPYHELASKN